MNGKEQGTVLLQRHPADRAESRDRLFYPALTLLISATAFAGFSFTYFGPIFAGSYPPAGLALHLHGRSFFLWYLLFPLR